MVLLGLPNLIYQVTNGLPQLKMGHALAEHNGDSSRGVMWPFLLLMLDPRWCRSGSRGSPRCGVGRPCDSWRCPFRSC